MYYSSTHIRDVRWDNPIMVAQIVIDGNVNARGGSFALFNGKLDSIMQKKDVRGKRTASVGWL